MQLEDLILMANGFTNDAANHKVEVTRLNKNRADTLANQLMKVFTIDVDSTLVNNGNKNTLEPLDYVFVPKLLNYRNLGTIKLGGEVLYAGEYALEKRNETIQEVIARAGGISPFASMSNVQVYRNSLRVATTLLESENVQEAKFLLRAGDSIYIPRSEPFVEVKGAVFNPQILSYKSASFMDYISDAGGVTDKGNLSKAYVQYSNGINRKIKHFLFFRNYPRIIAGSKIIVPEKAESERKGMSILEVSALTGSLSALISLISVLKK
jgi:protein involved in polysaccharide export with SLBB domain